jgi:hypothetical protein
LRSGSTTDILHVHYSPEKTMPIQVVCPGCKKRFEVSDKFAGKQGPCPQCKTVIKVPEKSVEVVIHAPETAGRGGKSATGMPVFKPIARKYLNATPAVWVGVIAGVVVVFLAAMLLGLGHNATDKQVSTVILAIGALVLAPPLALAGYIFLRDAELEPYRGTTLWIRIGSVALVYAVLWGALGFLKPLWGITGMMETYQAVVIVPALLGIGGLAAFAALELDYTTAVFHYSLYLGITVLLRLCLQLYPF